MDRPLAAFDIESIPDVEAGRRVLGLEGDDAAVMEGMRAWREDASDGRTDFLQPPLHRIVTISVAWLDPETAAFRLGSFGESCADEPRQLAEFFDVLARPKRAPRLVSWNGNAFDLPVLRYRAMLHGVAAAFFYRSDGEWKYNNYHGRYHDMHVDLMDVLAGFGASDRLGLDLFARTMGLPGKTVTHGADVHKHVLAGEDEVVRAYCEMDALNTLLLYLLWAFHRGRVDHAGLRRQLGAIIATLTTSGAKPAWQECGEALRGWPRWLNLPA
jgi:3'-5' exonuclease